MKKCPVCGASVKLENLERHVKNRHPRDTVDLSSAITKEERRKVTQVEAQRRQKITPGGFRIVLVVAAIVAIILAVAIINPFNTGPGVNQGAPDFTLTTTEGSTFRLSEALSVQPVLLEFMDVDCEYCQQEAGNVLRYVYQNYSGRVRFLSVDVNFVGAEDDAGRIATFKATYGTPWSYALDDDGKTTRAYGVNSTPTTFIINASGKIVEKIVGAAPGGYTAYQSALDEALG